MSVFCFWLIGSWKIIASNICTFDYFFFALTRILNTISLKKFVSNNKIKLEVIIFLKFIIPFFFSLLKTSLLPPVLITLKSGLVDDKANKLHAIASLRVLLDATKAQAQGQNQALANGQHENANDQVNLWINSILWAGTFPCLFGYYILKRKPAVKQIWIAPQKSTTRPACTG